MCSPNPCVVSNMIFAAIFLTAYVTSAIPVSQSAASKQELNQLVTLLGKLKDTQKARQDDSRFIQPVASILNQSGKLSNANPDRDFESLMSLDDDLSDFASDGDVSSGVRKRQGAWSLDYGLGGGRFGKRGYMDYGLGGGRFGRDVDHVDPNHDMETDGL